MDDNEGQSYLSRELEKVDRRIRIERLKQEAEEISGGEMVASGSRGEERAHWHESFPEDLIPDHEDPPYDRDRHLPKRDYRCGWQGGELGEKEEWA